MGVAVLDGDELIDYRVVTFRDGRRVHALLTQARQATTGLLTRVKPDIVVIEEPFFAKTRRSALLTFLVQELRGRLEGVKIREYGPLTVRKILLGNGRATKRDVARHVIDRFPELERHFHPDDFWREKYWSHVFDAVALGLTDQVARGRPRRR
jgi:Holliday junction resolvasome RuvABC endonuclease subunit